MIKLKEYLLVYKRTDNKYLITVFSLFSALGITFLPKVKEFQVFNYFPCAVLNNSSILIWRNEKYQDYLKTTNNISLFDASTKNRLIFYNHIFRIFNEITHRAITKIFYNNDPFYSIPVYNYLDISNLENYFNALLFNYSLQRKKYLENISNIPTPDNSLAKNILELINNKDAKNQNFQFGILKDFIDTLCNWPNINTEKNITDCIFSPFFSWTHHVKESSRLNFTQIAIILGELPLPYETIFNFDEKVHQKSIDLISDINENLFNELIYTFNKELIYREILLFDEAESPGEKRAKRIFSNYILFTLLIYKYKFYSFDNFDVSTKKLFNLIDYPKEDFEKGQQCFPYKIIFHILENYENISKILKLIWIKKLYPIVIYSMKKIGIIEDDVAIYGINEEIIDFRYFAFFNIQLDSQEIISFFNLLYKFINKELYQNTTEKKYLDYIYGKNRHRNNLYRPFLQNYIECQIYNIKLSLDNLKLKANQENLIKLIEEIKGIHLANSFYMRNITINLPEYFDIKKKFAFYTFDKNNKKTEFFLNIKECLRRESPLSKYNPMKIEIKTFMDKNLLNERFLFINNHKDDNTFLEEKNNPKFRKFQKSDISDIINFLFVPLKKELIPEYLSTAQKIYNDFYA